MQPEYEPLMEELVRLLLAEFGDRVVSVLLFGSVARGTARPDSDIDVCLVIRGLPVSRYRRHQLLTPVLERLRQTAAYLDLVRRRYSPDIAAISLHPRGGIRDEAGLFGSGGRRGLAPR